MNRISFTAAVLMVMAVLITGCASPIVQTPTPVASMEQPAATATLTMIPPTTISTLLPSPIGGVMAFSSIREGTSGADIFIMNTDGSNLLQMTNASGDDFPLDWSPDGKQLLFMSSRDGHFEIYVVNEDGSSVQQLTSSNRNNMFADWSPDGSKIAFQSGNANGSDFEIFIMNSDGTDQQQLTNAGNNNCNPDWSPDGSQIAFDSDRGGSNNIYVMKADGSNVQQLTSNLAAGGGMDPDWSPDGKQIVFSGNDTGLYMMDANGGNIINLPIGSGDAFSSAWSPDGSQIAFYSYRPGSYSAGKPSAIYVVGVDGKNLRQVTELTSSSSTPIWKPEIGLSLLQPEPANSQSTPITSDTTARVICLRKLEGHDPRLYGLAFSPDGRYFGAYSLDGVVQVWDRTSWQVIQEYRTSTVYGWRLFFLTDGMHISSGDGTVWNIASSELVHSLGVGHTVTFSPDGVWMASIYRGNPIIELRRVEDWQLEREITADPATLIFTLAISPDSRLLATTSHSLLDSQEHSVILWDMETGRELLTLPGHRDVIHGLAFSSDGRWIASASMDTTINLWDVQSGQLIYTFHAAAEMFDVTFSPDSSLVAAAMNNNTVELWDVDSGQWVRTLNHNGEVVSVAFSPDGTLLASGAYDGKIYIWGVP
jgi:Tol biopolymer transport system component